MPQIGVDRRQNDVVTRVVRLLAVLLVPALILTGCGAAKKPTPPTAQPTTSLPTNDVTVPSGVTLTKPGTTLPFGQPATVTYVPNPKRSTVLEITVTRVDKGAIRDFASYQLTPQVQASTPYYVQVKLKNVGEGDVGQTAVPLWAVDQTNTLIQASTFSNDFTKCPSKALPTVFAPNATATACLVYLVPNHGTLTGMSFRPLQEYAPITWTGKIGGPKVVKHDPKKTTHKKKA
ncbi:MAG: hypothetical protein JWR35_262 [Marmoricola sp.]|jgi:hypothetical protein|nr:hypothetical protein [Marmoricola sp.]